MILRNFLIADAVTFGSDRKVYIHGGGVGKLYATSFPWTQPQLAVYVSLLPEDEDEPGSDHNLTVDFEAPGGEVLEAMISGGFRIPPPDRDDFRPLITFGSQFVGAAFPGAGLYWVRVLYDEREVGRHPLELEERDQGRWIPVGQ